MMGSFVEYSIGLLAIALCCQTATSAYYNPYYPVPVAPPVRPYYEPSLYGPDSAISSNSSHHFQVGVPGPRDFLLYRQVQVKSGKLWRSVAREVSYPPVGIRNNATISCARALDQYVNGQGGYATLLNGGVGWKNVTLLLKSQSGKGFNFLVEIWGRY